MIIANGTTMSAETIFRNIVDGLVQKHLWPGKPGHKHSTSSRCSGQRLDGASPVQSLAHFLAGLEERHGLLVDGDMRTGPRISSGTGRTMLDRERAESTQLNPIALRHGAGDFTKDRVDDVLDVALIQMRILSSNSLYEFGLDH